MAGKIAYLGPADIIVVEGKEYRRPYGGEVDVPLNEQQARLLAATPTHHRFRVEGGEMATAAPGNQGNAESGRPTATATFGPPVVVSKTNKDGEIVSTTPVAPPLPVVAPAQSNS